MSDTDSSQKDPGIITDPVPEIVCSKCRCEIDVQGLDAFDRVECPDCGNIETIPAKLGPFLLLRLIGTGGMGGVYYARDESLGRDVAIKVMLRSLGENRSFVDQFQREAQLAAKLNHPHIVQIYSFGQEKGQPYIVMELVNGKHLDDMIESGEKLPQGMIMRIGLEVAEALKAAEDTGLLHGDVKPENILLDDKLRAKLVDFGLATFAHQAADDSIWGTPYYIAPEKVQRQKTDYRSDIYSLGATLYHALAGRPPFEGKTPIEVVKARLTKPPRELKSVRPDIDDQVDRICNRMLQQNPARRYPTYASLISDLRRVAKALPQPKKYPSVALTLRNTGKMTVAKKKPGLTIEAGTITHEEPPAPQQTRVRIKKKHRNPEPVMHRPKTEIAPARPASGKDALSQYRQKFTGTGKTSAPRRKSRSATPVVLTVFFLILAAGIGVLVKMKLDSQKQAAMSYAELRSNQTTAEEARNEIDRIAGDMMAMARAVEPILQAASNAYQVVMGRELVSIAPADSAVKKPALPLPPAEKEPVVAAPRTVAPEPEPEREPPAIKRDPSAPAGIMTREELEAARGGSPAGLPERAAEPPAATVPDDVMPKPQPEPPPKPKTREQKFTDLAYEVRNEGVKVKIYGESARQSREDVKIIYDRVQECRAFTRTLAIDVQKITSELAVLKERKKESQESFRTAEEGVKELNAVRETVERERAEARAEEERRLAEAERQRLAAEHKALVEKETIGAAELGDSIMGSLKQHRFKECVRSIQDTMETYRTDEGKAALQLLLDRAGKLAELKDFLIKRLEADPLEWGWIQDRATVDVLGATEDTVRIKGGKEVPWSEVTPKQMMRFVVHYLENENLKARELADLNLAAGIYSNINEDKDAARRFADRALTLCPFMEKDIRRLIPE